MSFRAWAFIWIVFLGGIAFTISSYFNMKQVNSFWVEFTALTILATFAQLWEATFNRQAYYPHFTFFFAGVLMLPPVFFIWLVTIPHLVEWIKKRLTKHQTLPNWYIQPFNIATHIIAASISYWLNVALRTTPFLANGLVQVLGAVLSALVYVVCVDLLVSLALYFARGIPFNQSKLLTVESLIPELILANLGYVVAVLWPINPWLLLPALSPMVIINEALKIPLLKQEAQTDGKTGLLNARHYNRMYTHELERAKRFNRPLTVIMADLDLMRNINNNYGHLAGDAVLAGIGAIIRNTLREFDLAGRFGGEEFAFALPEVGPAEARVLANRLRAAIADSPLSIPNSEIKIHATMSFGFACFPEDGSEAEKLIHAADVAVYYSKRNGRNRVSWIGEVPASVKLEFAGLEDKTITTEEPPAKVEPPPPTPPAAEKMPDSTEPGSSQSLEQQIQLGLERNEFEVYYQPQVSLRDGEIVGVEALVRWHHPERGLVMPGEFVPLAEQTRLICQLDRWVLEEACRQVQIWNHDRPVNHPLALSVNLSARNLEEENLPETIALVLARTRLNPHWLQLELTETVFAEISDANIQLLLRLKELGLSLAIDDFGTGFAGMNYLRFFPVDTLKIARSFVQSLDASPKSKAIVQSIIGLGQNLKMAIVAEGVEDGKEVACLNAWGCKLIQGYYFARPLPRPEFEALIKPSFQNFSNSIPALKKKPIELAQFQVS